MVLSPTGLSLFSKGDASKLLRIYQDARQVKKLFLVHGEYDVQLQFKQRLIKKGFMDVEIPEQHYEIGLT